MSATISFLDSFGFLGFLVGHIRGVAEYGQLFVMGGLAPTYKLGPPQFHKLTTDMLQMDVYVFTSHEES